MGTEYEKNRLTRAGQSTRSSGPVKGPYGRTTRIAGAVADTLANEGWGAVNAAAVARDAGLSVATVRTRAKTRVDLVRLAWEQLISEPLVTALGKVKEAVGPLARTKDLEPLVLAWLRLTRRTVEIDAAMELVVVANTHPEIAAIIDPQISPLIDPQEQLEQAHRLQHVAVMAVALGLLMNCRHPWSHDRQLRETLTRRANVFAAAAPAEGPPRDAEQYLTWVEVMDSRDHTLDDLLCATVRMIARFGADDFTVKDVAKEVGCTEGLVFSRYPSKLALVADALRIHSVRMWESMADTARVNTLQFGPAMAGAIYGEQFMSAERAKMCAVNLEQARVSWHHTPLLVDAIERIAAFRRSIGEVPGWGQLQADLDFFLDFAEGTGGMLVRRFVPDAGSLPWLSIATARVQELYGRGSQ